MMNFMMMQPISRSEFYSMVGICAYEHWFCQQRTRAVHDWNHAWLRLHVQGINDPADEQIRPVAEQIYNSLLSERAREDWRDGVYQVSKTYCICSEEADFEEEINRRASQIDRECGSGRLATPTQYARSQAEFQLGLRPADVAVLAHILSVTSRLEGKPADDLRDWFKAQRERYSRALSSRIRY